MKKEGMIMIYIVSRVYQTITLIIRI